MEEDKQNKDRWTPANNELDQSERLAIQAIYDLYAKVLFVFINYRVKEAPDVVNELLQITLERICRKADRIPEGDEARAWMIEFAKRVIWEHYRRKEKKQSFQFIDPVQDPEDPDRPDPAMAIPAKEEADEELLVGEMQELIYNHLHLLTDREQTVFLHVFEEDLTPAEISKIYAVSVQTVKNQLSRARAKLVRLFEKYYSQ